MTTASGTAVRPDGNVARLKRLGIDTYQEQVLYMSHDNPVCLSEGWLDETRVLVSHNGTSVMATLNVVTNGILAPDEAGLSEAAWRRLGAKEGDLIQLAHAKPVESMSFVRARAYHSHVSAEGIRDIIRDIADGRYSAIELAAFVTAFAGDDLRRDEITALARATVAARVAGGHATRTRFAVHGAGAARRRGARPRRRECRSRRAVPCLHATGRALHAG